MHSTCTINKQCTFSERSHLTNCVRPPLPTQCSSGFARRCLAFPLSRQRCRQSPCPAIQAAQIKPAYNKYRSRYDIDQDYIKQWKEITARDSIPKKVTPLSFLWFVPIFVKYHMVPGVLRYAWWLVWSAILAARYQARKHLVLQGAKLDVQLMKSGKSNERPSFSRSFVLRRLHGHVSLLDNIKYRVDLLQGRSQPTEQATVPG